MNLKSKIAVISLGLITGFFITTSFVSKPPVVKKSDQALDILWKLKDDMPLHYRNPSQLDSVKINYGKNLVTKGFTNPNKKGKRQSKHFVCTDCHNIQREDPDLTQNNPDTRLDYVAKHKIKFLPGTTLYGTINKSHWYNDDYSKKYGELVDPARDTLENAIQLCAEVCSQGRPLCEDEMEAVIHYFNSIGYTIQDLNLSDKENLFLTKTLSSKPTGADKEDAIRLIKSKYQSYSDATFMKPQSIENRKLGEKGNPAIGSKIYNMSCLPCHKEGGVTNYKLNNDQLTFKHLKKFAKTHKYFSVYDITRKGTYVKNGYKPYMPNFTKERLSNKQLEDLVAYFNLRSKGDDLFPNTKN